jgi:hypothetical protein
MAISAEKLADILLKEYEIRTVEINMFQQDYFKHLTYVQFYSYIVAAVGGVLLSDDVQKITTKLSLKGGIANTLYFIILMYVAFIGFYLVSVTLERLHGIALSGMGKALVERHINKLCENNVLEWETRIAPAVNAFSYLGHKTWVKPSALFGIWVCLIFIISNTLLCFLSFYTMGTKTAIFYSAIIVLLTLFHIYQYYALAKIGFKVMRDIRVVVTFKINEIAGNSKAQRRLPVHHRRDQYRVDGADPTRFDSVSFRQSRARL